MKQNILLSVVTIVGLLTFTGEAQTLAINNIMDIVLVCQVQQAGPPNASTTNLEINTQSLLELIATDQGFTLPSHAKLWLANNSFSVLRADNTIFANIDTNILNIIYGTTVLKSKLIQTSKIYSDTIKETSVVALVYNGTAISFSLNFVGENNFVNDVNFAKATNNAIVSSSFSGLGFGSGTCGGQGMVVTGSLTGKYSFRYTAGGGTFPSGTGSGAFPSSGMGIFPH
jgi:hypothetical protein